MPHDKILITKENCTYDTFVALREQFGSYKKILESIKFEYVLGDMAFDIFNALYERDLVKLLGAVNDMGMALRILAQALNRITDMPFIMEVAGWKFHLDEVKWTIFWQFLDDERRTAVIAQLKGS